MRQNSANTAKAAAACSIIFFLLLLGYMVMIYAVATAPAPVFIQENHSTVDFKDVETKDATIAELTNQLNALKEKFQNAEMAHAVEINTVEVPSKQHSVAEQAYRPGLLILGMHRSGTSIVGGLVNKMGLKTGGPLIGPAEDNAKGFFERIDVVLQNDYLMRKQHIEYTTGMHRYDHQVALKHILNDDGTLFKEGKRGLKFLNDKESYPWMLKDPRLCVTFRTWLPLLNFVPAVLFTYRHPMDVAMSFFKRYEHLQIGKSLRMWYVYNRRAIDQSHDLCRVVTSHRAVMRQPQVEMDRIYDEIRQCGVPAPRRLTKDEIEEFVDPKLQHGKSALQDHSCDGDTNALELPASWDSQDRENHLRLYREVMRVFCALEDRSAFAHDFKWDMSIQD